MRLQRIIIEGEYKSLKNQDFDFSQSDGEMLVFAGLNGSGKSQLLEIIGESFSFLERSVRNEFKVSKRFDFEVTIYYELTANSDIKRFKIIIPKSTKILFYKYDKNACEWKTDALKIDKLPHVVGYSSGLNENLQRSFLKNSLQYYKVMSVRHNYSKKIELAKTEEERESIESYYLNRYSNLFYDEGKYQENIDDINRSYESLEIKVEDDNAIRELLDNQKIRIDDSDIVVPNLKFLDYDTNGLLLFSLLTLKKTVIKKILNYLGFSEIKNVKLTYDFRYIPMAYDNIKDIKQIIDFVGRENVIGHSRITSDDEYDLYELDYLSGELHFDLSDISTKEYFEERYYHNPETLFNKLYKLQLLGIKNWDKKVRTKLLDDDFFGNVKKPLKTKLPITIESLTLYKDDCAREVDYHDLSDGESQLLTVLCSINIFCKKNTLFIFDEPETHLNPAWRTYFSEYINEMLLLDEEEDNKCQFLVSTHSPFILSSLPKNNVFRFTKSNNGSNMHSSDINTYGASFEVLIKQFFGLKSLISQSTIKKIKNIIHSDESNEYKQKWIEENLGDSMEKSYLMKRLIK